MKKLFLTITITTLLLSLTAYYLDKFIIQAPHQSLLDWVIVVFIFSLAGALLGKVIELMEIYRNIKIMYKIHQK